jgi:acyl-ACP thioesterase
MAKERIGTSETVVKSYETDFQGKWKPSCFFQAMQEAATRHATQLGFGRHEMMDQDMLWLLARSKIKFDRIPSFGEHIKIETWPKGIQQKIFFMRDFFFFDMDGNQLAAASSAWVLVHLSDRRILKPEENLPGELPDIEDKHALNEQLMKINVPAGLSEQFVVEARYSDTDIMAHVNNTRYIEWAMNCFSFEFFRSNRPDWIQINFAHEVKPFERVSVASGQPEGDPDAWILQGTNLSTGMRAFEVAINWSKKQMDEDLPPHYHE